jgi:hypothetical protein
VLQRANRELADLGHTPLTSVVVELALEHLRTVGCVDTDAKGWTLRERVRLDKR